MEDEAAYATRIEEAFIAERGTPFLLSSEDWTLIRGWREAGVPVDTVVRAVHETFERRRERGAAGKINSIAYCAGAVEEQWEMERRGLVGRGTGSGALPAEEIAPRLLRLASRLDEASSHPPSGVEPEAFQRKVRTAAEKVRALPGGAGFDRTEGDLGRLEKALLSSLERFLAGTERTAIQERVKAALEGTEGISPAVVGRMRRALRRREVRRVIGLPPLTLFDT